MFTGKIAYCRQHMTAFINGELPEHARRRVARYIDSSPDCYKLYIQERQLQRDLRGELITLARPHSAELSRVWQSIQSEMERKSVNRAPVFHKRYGLVTVTLLLMILLPFAADSSPFSQSVATPPTPRGGNIETIVTISPVQPTAVAVATLQPSGTTSQLSRIVPEAVPPRTPEANLTGTN